MLVFNNFIYKTMCGHMGNIYGESYGGLYVCGGGTYVRL